MFLKGTKESPMLQHGEYVKKTLLLCIILSCVFTVSVFGDLTPQALEKIGEKTEEQIQNSEKSMKTHITQEREKTDIKIQALDKLIERTFYFLIGLIALIAVAMRLFLWR